MGGIRSVLLTGFLCLVLASAGAALWIERYEQTGPELLVENWAVVDPDAGQVLRENNIWSLIAGDPEKSVRLQQTIAPKAGCKRVRLSADLRWENVTAGDKPWH